MLTIQELTSDSGLTDFVQFPFSLFAGNPYWVPPLISDEVENLNPQQNPVFNDVEAHYYMAYRNGEPVGRIAAIINWLEVKEQQLPKVRFGYFDVIDDPEVTKALLQKVYELGNQHDLEFIEGPLGLSNMDKAGMLIDGFDEPNTMITWYGKPYYRTHIEQLGFEKQKEWVEYEIQIPRDGSPDKIGRFSSLVKDRYNLKSVRFSNTREVVAHAEEMFNLINETYRELSTYVPIKSHQVEYYKERYMRYLHPDFINCVANENGELIAFAITMPSFAEALRKAEGALFPFGWFHLLKTRYFPQKASFYLIGIKPEYQNKGVTAIIFDEMNKVFNEKGISVVETNPELEDNEAIQALWQNYEHRLHKRRRTYRKAL